MREIRRVRPDVVYSGSLFSRMNVGLLLARRAKLIGRVPFILAPHGELTPSALALKAWKKRPFLAVALASHVFEDMIWQASSEFEKNDIVTAVGAGKRPDICVAPDIVRPAATQPPRNVQPKQRGAARFVFLSRITRMKNLRFVIDAMRELRGEVSFDIHGPIDDPMCWRECQTSITRLPPNIRVEYRGPVAPEDVTRVFARYDFSVLPTLGENFGHVVFEALQAGCPIVLSDRTMWRTLSDDGAGWSLSVEDRTAWTATLQACVDLGPDDHAKMRAAARRVATRLEDSDAVERNVQMFEMAVRPLHDW
jgi:glycosyltransferase involved in cell wall biosynthesis